VKAAYPDGPTSQDYTSIVNDRQYSILIDLLDDARAHGAEVIEVGHRPGDAANRPHTLAPSVVLGVTDEMRIAHEETFGPVLPMFGYRDIDDAIAYVNARPRPLALHYFGGNDADRRKVLDRTTSGNVTVNGTIMHVGQDDLPFGGVGESGMGKYHGIEGFPHPQPSQGHLRPGPLEQHQPPARVLWQACRRAPQLLPPLNPFAAIRRHRSPSTETDPELMTTPPKRGRCVSVPRAAGQARRPSRRSARWPDA